MYDCYITFRSVTIAQRGESVLRRANIGVSLQRTPRWMEEQGCGYSLGIYHDRAEGAVRLLKNAGIGYRKVYIQQENGAFEEWKA